ncbi:MAG: hypothetical protein O9324_25605 [Microcystis sp. LE19-84.1B]|uniref:hypothetical protein n=1 Tax=Microcystis sp. LE19-84.1B TaxID=3016438 RepID=UPI0022C0D75F|nr:hypothetical protein [Microcystis sp. LE19-84.1B]MCZ8227212.1 hypothetical protein [Microcystis sp. LE19-84.1B]
MSSYQLSVISYQESVISYQESVISYQLSVISYQLSGVSYQESVIRSQLSGDYFLFILPTPHLPTTHLPPQRARSGLPTPPSPQFIIHNSQPLID